MDYQTYAATMRTMLAVPLNLEDSNFESIIPRMIEYAELRIYRELDFLSTVTATTGLLTANSRNVTMPTGIIVLNDVNIITPSSTTNPDLGTRKPLQRVSLEYINAVYPSVSGATVPAYYALLSDTAVRLAPWPDAAYTAEFIGTTRPDPLSPTNTTTFISENLPDLFVAASMVFGAGYQRDFGAQSDDPKMAQSWENQYQTLKAGCNAEELRKKAEAPGWSPLTPSPAANTPRARSAA